MYQTALKKRFFWGGDAREQNSGVKDSGAARNKAGVLFDAPLWRRCVLGFSAWILFHLTTLRHSFSIPPLGGILLR
jgi:hypothetical protein